jgi:hypothetical protein
MSKKKKRSKKSNKKSSQKLLFLRYLKPLLIIIGVLFILFSWEISKKNNQFKKPNQHKVVHDKYAKLKTSLPGNWSIMKPTPERVELKIVKNSSTSTLKPSIVLIKNTISDKDYAHYTDQLIKGAQATLNTLTFTEDITSQKKGFFERDLTGYYYNGDKQIIVKDTIYIKSTVLYMISAAYDVNEEKIPEEVQIIFKEIEKTFLY